MSEPTRVYENDEIKVEWRPELCTHCENCITSLPEVFDLAKRPWVNINGAPSDRIAEVVGQCPDGALSLGVKQQ